MTRWGVHGSLQSDPPVNRGGEGHVLGECHVTLACVGIGDQGA